MITVIQGTGKKVFKHNGDPVLVLYQEDSDVVVEVEPVWEKGDVCEFFVYEYMLSPFDLRKPVFYKVKGTDAKGPVVIYSLSEFSKEYEKRFMESSLKSIRKYHVSVLKETFETVYGEILDRAHGRISSL